MPIKIILLEPREEGNIGSVARAMKNFGFSELILINPPKIGGVARAFAAHGFDVLKKAKTYDSLDQVIDECDFLVGTTGKKGGHKTYKRRFVTPEKLAENLNTKSNVGLLFGREDIGLKNEELEKCDFAVHIQTNPKYPVLNLAQAACVVLYELGKPKKVKNIDKPALPHEKELLKNFMDKVVLELYEHEHQQKSAKQTLSLVFGRAFLSKKETRNIISFFKQILKKRD